MPICPVCGKQFDAGEQFCPRDGVSLRADELAGVEGDPLVGRVVGGRYRIEEKLGQGGMGAVYRAVHVLMDKPVAVKVLKEGLAGEREAAARFHREARSASRLDHEYCIRVTDFGRSDDGLLYLAMELLEGHSLGKEARRGPLAPSRVAAIGVAVAEALQHAHESGVIHRDLKPDNIFLVRRGKRREVVKVLDFGLAKLVTDGAAGSSITRDGTVFGTPEYMAPEQAEGENLDGRTDIYALGVILYQLLTGEVPFSASNFVALLTKQVSEPPQSLTVRKPDLILPPGFAEIVMRCLEKKRDRRFATAQALADALWPFVDEAALLSISLPTRSEDSRPSIELGRERPDPTPTGPTELPRATPVPTSTSLPLPSGGSSTDSIAPTSVDSFDRPPVRRTRKQLAIALGAVGLVGALGLGLWRLPRPAPRDKPQAQVNLDPVRSLIVAGKLDDAEQQLAGAPESATTLFLRSAIAEQRGERLNALGMLHEAARREPQNPEPQAQLSALLQRLGHAREACKVARQALDLDATGPSTQPARTVRDKLRCKD